MSFNLYIGSFKGKKINRDFKNKVCTYDILIQTPTTITMNVLEKEDAWGFWAALGDYLDFAKKIIGDVDENYEDHKYAITNWCFSQIKNKNISLHFYTI